MSTTILVDAARFRGAVLAADLFRDRNHTPAVPALGAILLQVRDSRLEVAATDRYRLVETTLSNIDGDNITDDTLLANGAALVVAVKGWKIPARPRPDKYQALITRADPDVATVKLLHYGREEQSHHVPLLVDDKFPNHRTLFGPTIEPDNQRTPGVVFNPAFLADIGKAVKLVGDKTSRVRFTTPRRHVDDTYQDTTRPARFDLSDELLDEQGINMRGLLMPVREGRTS